jgi:hypothetical protein
MKAVTLQHDAPTAKQTTTWTSLHAAEASGPDALTAFIRRDMKERDDRAEEEWQGYALYCPADRSANGDPATMSRSYTHIVNPRGQMYRIEVTGEGVKRFALCPAQILIDAINEAARRQGIALRVESKHATAIDRLQSALRRGEREWKPFPAIDGMPEGFYSVPTGARNGGAL